MVLHKQLKTMMIVLLVSIMSGQVDLNNYGFSIRFSETESYGMVEPKPGDKQTYRDLSLRINAEIEAFHEKNEAILTNFSDMFLYASESKGDHLYATVFELMKNQLETYDTLTYIYYALEEYDALNMALIEEGFDGSYDYTRTDDGKLVKEVVLGNLESGFMVYPLLEVFDGYIPKERTWYKKGLETSDFYWSAPYIDAFTGDTIFTISKSIKSDSDETLGVIGLDVSGSRFTDNLEAVADKTNCQIIVATNDGLIVFNSENDHTSTLEEMGMSIFPEEGYYAYEHEGSEQHTYYSINTKRQWHVFTNFN